MIKDHISSWQSLRLIKDVTLWPKINPRKARNAIKKYGINSLTTENIFLIIDNTIFRSAKQGMFLTEDTLYAFSEYSGKFSIKFKDITTLKPMINNFLKIPLIGIEVNKDYFISLPGLSDDIKYLEDSLPAIILLAHFLAELFSCELLS